MYITKDCCLSYRFLRDPSLRGKEKKGTNNPSNWYYRMLLYYNLSDVVLFATF